MPTRKLGDVAVGEIVKLKENRVPVNYIVVNQGKPHSIYDDSCDGTWLMRQDLIESRPWDRDKSRSNKYEESDIHQWLNSTMLSKYEANIRGAIKQAKIPYFKVSSYTGNPSSSVGSVQIGANGLSCKIFLLSIHEVGIALSNDDIPVDGKKLAYFELGEEPSANNKRIATLSETPYEWTLRTIIKTWDDIVSSVDENGDSDFNYTSNSCGIRPTLVLPPDITIEGDLVTINSAPNSPVTITVPDIIRGGENVAISWPASSDPDGNLEGYIVERSYNGGSAWSQIYQGRATSATTTVLFGTETVMFRVQAYDTAGAKSGWRTSENRTVVNNRAPAAPPSISVPLSPAGGDKLTITWTASTDADGNLEGYELERQWDGSGAFTRIYKSAALSYQDDIPKGEHTSVVYRVRAYDSFAAYSSYTTSPSRTIDNNTAPVIACDLSGDLGEKSEGFTIPYTVSDAEQQEVTVTEKVGNLVKRTYKPTLGQQNTFEVTGEYFQKILNGAQTVQIVATDSAGKSSTLQLTFTKAVHRAVITLSEPLAVEKQITVAVLAITGKIPADATQLIELTNNGNDPEPVWEDATADVKAGRNYVFKNKTQTNGWAFNFRVTVERGGSDEDGYITAIQGGFQ